MQSFCLFPSFALARSAAADRSRSSSKLTGSKCGPTPAPATRAVGSRPPRAGATFPPSSGVTHGLFATMILCTESNSEISSQASVLPGGRESEERQRARARSLVLSPGSAPPRREGWFLSHIHKVPEAAMKARTATQILFLLHHFFFFPAPPLPFLPLNFPFVVLGIGKLPLGEVGAIILAPDRPTPPPLPVLAPASPTQSAL